MTGLLDRYLKHLATRSSIMVNRIERQEKPRNRPRFPPADTRRSQHHKQGFPLVSQYPWSQMMQVLHSNYSCDLEYVDILAQSSYFDVVLRECICTVVASKVLDIPKAMFGHHFVLTGCKM